MRRKSKSFHKSIVFGEKKLAVFSQFVTHPVTGFTLDELREKIDWSFLDKLDLGRKTRGRPPLPFRAKCKMMFGYFCKRIPSLTELSRQLKNDDKLRDFCGFQKGKTPSKQAISVFLINFPLETQKQIFLEVHKQLQQVEYTENNTLSVDGCVYRTVNKRKKRQRIEKRNNETGRMKQVHGIKQVVGVLAQRMVCSGFITDFDGRHDSVYYEDVLEETRQNNYNFRNTAADKAFDSNDLRWNTLLNHGAIAVIPKREYEKKDSEQKTHRNRKRNSPNFVDQREQEIYNDRTAVERYFYKLEIPLGLYWLKTKRDESGRTVLNFANCFDVICRTIHLKKNLENAMVQIS